MKIRALGAAAIVAFASLAIVPAANAGGQVCYDVSVVVNGDAVIDEAACQDLP